MKKFIILLVLNLILYPSPALSAPLLRELLRQALVQNPGLQAARLAWERAQAESPAAEVPPDPRIGAGLKDMMFSLPQPGPAAMGVEEPLGAVALMWEQEIPFPGKLGLMGQMARNETDMRWQAYRLQELAVLTALKEKYFQLHYVHQAIATLQETRELTEKLLKAAQIQYSVGKAIQQDLFKAQLELGMQTEQLWMLERQAEELTLQLNQLAGNPPQAQLGYPALPAYLPELPAADQLEALALAQSPHWLEARVNVAEKQLALQWAAAEYQPDFMVSGGYMNRGVQPAMWEVMVAAAIPIFAAQKQDIRLKSARASLEEADWRQAQTWLQLQTGIRQELVMARTERRLLELYEKKLVPQARLTLDAALSAYLAGQADFMTVLENLKTVLAYQLLVHQKAVGYFQALARLEGMTGAESAAEGGQRAP